MNLTKRSQKEGYEDISRVLGIQRTTVKAVTDKSRKFETVVNENYSTTDP